MLKCVSLIGLVCLFLWSLPAKAAEVFISSPPFNPNPGQQFDVEIIVETGANVLGSYFFNFQYNPAVVSITSVEGGDTPAFSSPPITDPSTFSAGVTPVADAQGGMSSPAGSISVVTLTLQASTVVGGTSALDVEVIELNSAGAEPLEHTVFPGAVQVAFDAGDDTDGDGLTDLVEANAGTDINLEDTDGDGLQDGFEVLNGLNPLDNGSSNPADGADGDPDSDGLTNAQEQALGSSPTLGDTDGDGLGDEVEAGLGTDPTVEDSDGDGLSDAFEVDNDLDPLDDGAVDSENGGESDPDSDGLNNIEEQAAGTLAHTPDTDGDGLPDGFEVANNLDPLDDGSVVGSQGEAGDPDLDGHSNLSEFQTGSDPRDDHSQPVDIELRLTPDLQLVHYPAALPAGATAYDLLSALNNNGASVSSIETVANGVVQRAQWDTGTPSGEDFALPPGRGVIAGVEALSSQSIQEAVVCPSIDLSAGINLVGFHCVFSGMNSGELANALSLSVGGEVTVQRFDSATGRYQTMRVDGSQTPSGQQFPIRVGEAYLVHMPVDLTDFDLLEQR